MNRLTISGFISAALLLWGLSAAANREPASPHPGKRVYDRWCIDCHGDAPGFFGDGLTGTTALEAKYGGQIPAVLEKRTDLTPPFVALFVRRGVSVMPFFRRTEISDAELVALTAYLSRISIKDADRALRAVTASSVPPPKQ